VLTSLRFSDLVSTSTVATIPPNPLALLLARFYAGHMIKLYGSLMSSAARCYWMLEEVGVPYEAENVDLRDPAARAKFETVFPGGKVPYFVDGDVRLFESMAINGYLAAKYKPELVPSDIFGKALVDQWSYWAIANLQPEVMKIMFHTMFLPEDQRNPKELAAGRAGCARFLKQLEDALTGEYLVGNSFTLADLNCGSVVGLVVHSGIETGPRVKAWLTRLSARPAFQKTLGSVSK